MKLSSLWRRFADRDDREDELKASIVANSYVLELFEEILDKRIDKIRRGRVQGTQYDKASWTFSQAHLNGCEETLLEIKKLLDFEE